MIGHVGRDLVGDAQHVFDIGRTVLVRRRADGDELESAVLDAFCCVRGEDEPAGGAVFLDEPFQTGLVDRNMALLEAFDFAGVDVDADHVMSRLGKDRRLHEADVTRSKECHLHFKFSTRIVGRLLSSPQDPNRSRVEDGPQTVCQPHPRKIALNP